MLYILSLFKMVFNCDQTEPCMFWHHKISKDKTGELDSRVEPESSMESKPEDKVGEQFGGCSGADHCRQENEGGPRPSYLSREDLTDDYLKSKIHQTGCSGEHWTLMIGLKPSCPPAKMRMTRTRGAQLRRSK